MATREKLYTLFFSQDPKNRTLAFELAKAAGYYDAFVRDLYQELVQVPSFQKGMVVYEEVLRTREDELDKIELIRNQLIHLSEFYFDDVDLSQDYSKRGDTPLHPFPEIVLRFSQATELDLSWNNFECLPQDMSGLCNIKTLTLRGNKALATAVEKHRGLGRLLNLETLIIEDCNLFDHQEEGRIVRKLPEYFRNFTQLTTLEIENSVLYSFPDWIHELKNLERIRIAMHNWAETMYPPRFNFPKSFSLLPNLQELIVEGQYEIWRFPNIGKLTQLRKLVLDGVSSRFLEGITQLKKLEYLKLSISSDYPVIHKGKTWNFDKRGNKPPRGVSRIQLYGFEWLKQMPWLQEFHFEVYDKAWKFTNLEKEELAQALPNCKLI